MRQQDPLYLRIQDYFLKEFKTDPLFIKSPGRVNLIGEHTDYNNGFVLPAAIDKYILLGLAPNNTDTCRLYAANLDEYFEFIVNANTIAKSEQGWPNYIMGVVDQLLKNDIGLQGFDCVFGGNIPIGAGMSSSAAIEGGLIYGLSEVFNLNIDNLTKVKLAQKAENDFVGVQCGIMDQFINIFGKENHALKLDCRSLDYEYFPFDNHDFRIVLCDSNVKHDLATSEYNVRRQQCEEGVKILHSHYPDVNSLRDVDLEMIESHKTEFNPVILKRCEYVVEENQRVNDACQDLINGDFISFGQRMFDSHDGLKNKYEVSCNELDILVDIAKEIEGVYGSRMMGGGFGGCTINIVQKDKVEDFAQKIQKSYTEQTGNNIKIYRTKIENGVSTVYQSEISK
ncbi:MAG TPA: galactokinase [Balneolales bacterium]|nr:galactokinase [Balneolales bacterium]